MMVPSELLLESRSTEITNHDGFLNSRMVLALHLVYLGSNGKLAAETDYPSPPSLAFSTGFMSTGQPCSSAWALLGLLTL